jgi:hypothetical protein
MLDCLAVLYLYIQLAAQTRLILEGRDHLSSFRSTDLGARMLVRRASFNQLRNSKTVEISIYDVIGGKRVDSRKFVVPAKAHTSVLRRSCLTFCIASCSRLLHQQYCNAWWLIVTNFLPVVIVYSSS